MESKQIKNFVRIFFIKKFTEEIIINLSKKYDSEKKIRIEKLKQKFNKSIFTPEDEFKKIINHKILKPLKYQPSDIPIPAQKLEEKIYEQKKETEQFPIKKSFLSQTIHSEHKGKSQEFGFGKIETLIKDSFVQAIECPGPGKNILVKKFGKINVTKFILSQEEISDIINLFSTEAKIPLVEGILKAAVGDLLISAVTSDYVGSRFIISKIFQRPALNI